MPDGSGGWRPAARFIYATRVNVPDLIVTYSSGAPSTVYRVLTDHVGSVRAIVPASGGAATQIFDYDAFGNVLTATPPYPAMITDTPSALQTFGFAGGMYDPHSKLVRFGARDYEPETGRWLAKDPLGFGGGDLMLFGYTASDPVNKIDPTGLYGTNDCSYYDAMCRKEGGVYNCTLAKYMCTRTPGKDDPDPDKKNDWEGWPRCVRQCLQDCDMVARRRVPKSTCELSPLVVGNGSGALSVVSCHAACFVECNPFTGPPY